jgi:signal transduction histidine kinase
MAFGVQLIFRRRQAAWWTLVTGLALTAALGWELHREAVEMDRQRLVMRAAEIQGQLDFRLEKSEMLLDNLRDYLMWSGESRERVFQRWCYESGLLSNCPWILGIAAATNRNQKPWPAHLPSATDTWTTSDFTNVANEVWNHLIECELALKSELKSGNQFLTDYNLRHQYLEEGGKRRNPDRLATVIRNSSLSMSLRRPVMLDPSSNTITGTLFYVPIYRTELADHLAKEVGEIPRTNERAFVRWLLLSSLIVAPVDFKVLAESVWDGAPADLGIEIYSSTNLTVETWMNATEGGPRAANPRFKAYLTHHQVWPMYRQSFTIFFYTTPLFEAQSPRRLAKVAMAAGAALTVLASALVGVALRARNRQELMLEQIREARDALAAAQEERNKFSRDLHDGTIQSLYAIQLGLGHTLNKLVGEPAKAGGELSALRDELDAVIVEIRQFITTEATANEPVDFCAVLDALMQRARAGSTAELALRCDAAASARLSDDQAVQLANIAREALSNSLRHAQPRRVEVALRGDDESVILEIADDGTGFDSHSPARSGVGLASMSARAREMGGTFEIESASGTGTRVAVRIPVEAPEPAEIEDPVSSSEE